MPKDISPLESIYDIIYYWLSKEIHQEGILDDVSLIINSSARYDNLDAPLIWLEKEEITTTIISHSNNMSLDVPVSIICCDEVIDTEVEAESSAWNLACRCITALYLNIVKPLPHSKCVTLRNFRVQRLYPNIPPTGNFDITNKTMMMAAARVDVVFTFEVDWILYESIMDGEHVLVDYSAYEEDDDYVDGGEHEVTPTIIRPKPEYALANHRHDDLYAPLVHYHDELYSPFNHRHDEWYSSITHRHDDLYSNINHNHDNQYSNLNHMHPEYATKGEVAQLAGANHTHHHVMYVSPFRVQGEITGVICEIEPSDAIVLEDPLGSVFTGLDIRGSYVFLEQTDADPNRVYHLVYYVVTDDDVQRDINLNVNNVMGNRGESVNLYSIVSDVNNAPVDEGDVRYDLDYGDEQP